MKNLKYIVYAVGFGGLSILFTATSCKKLIQIPNSPTNSISSDRLFADSADIISAVYGVYNNFGVGSLSFASGEITAYTGLSGDELVVPSSGVGTDLQFYDNQISPNANSSNASMWANAYKCIYQINACLDGISTTNAISGALKKQLIAELKVDRALYYFNMVNLWGPVPLVTTTNYKVSESLPRASTDAVYNQIVADLTEAKNDLTVTYPSDGRARPNLYVADALLSRIYLYLGQWKNAEDAASLVINSGLYTLNTDVTTVFLDGSNEAIWQLPSNARYSATAEGNIFIPTSGSGKVATNVVPHYSLSANLLNAFETGDLRKQKWTGQTTVTQAGVTTTFYYPYKYKNLLPASVPAEDYMIIRLAEVYLIRAEARDRQNNVTGALEDLNTIRNTARTGLAPYAGNTDQQSVLNGIIHERQRELFCEWGNRWYDLKRTNLIDSVLGTEKTGWKTTDALFPIPIAELQSNPFLTQNPGY